MHRLAYKFYRFVSTLHYVTTRRLTYAGWIVLIGIFLTGGMAMDVEQAIGYQAFTLLMCVAGTSLVSSFFFRGRFEVERLLPRFGTAGELVRYQIAVRNKGAKPQPGLFVFDNLRDPRPSFDDFRRATQPTSRRRSFRVSKSPAPPKAIAPRPQPLPTVLAGAESLVEMQLRAFKRGVLHFRSVSLARPDPFSLCRAFVSLSAPASITILPRRYPLPNVALPGASRYRQGGVAFASSVGQSEEFVALRDYRQGDPLRRIHWRSWAKAGKPVVKEFQDEFFVRHALILDTFTEPDNVEVFEEAVSVAASFACTIDTQESLLDLLFVGPEAYCFTAGRGAGQAEQMLEILASVQTCLDKPFPALQQIVIEHSPSVSGCICIFLAWDEQRQELVRRLEALDVPVMVLLVHDGSVAIESSKVSTPVHELRVGRIEEDLATL